MTSPVRGANALEARLAQLPHVAAAKTPEPPAPTAESREPFAQALNALGRQIDAGEKLVQRALMPGASGLGAADLIALQAGIYRYSEAVDLAAKVVDRAGYAVRTTLQAGGGQ